jgi:serine/threonine protein kinase
VGEIPAQAQYGSNARVGTDFGRYHLQKEIGGDASGVVYRARDIRSDRPVAIKLLDAQLLAQPSAWGFLVKQAQILSTLNHPCICTIYGVGEEDHQPYIAMEYIEGCTLNELLMPSGLSPSVLAHPTRQIASALAHAHERGIIHRDIKSSNIVITKLGDVKILDFGLAKRLRPGAVQGSSAPPHASTETGEDIHYLAPEILQGERANVWTDIWSFGVLLYELATGELPFRGKTVTELSTAIMTSGPAPPSRKIPVWVGPIVAKCLQRDLARRYHCMREIIEDLPSEGIAECVDLAMDLDQFYTCPGRTHAAGA